MAGKTERTMKTPSSKTGQTLHDPARQDLDKTSGKADSDTENLKDEAEQRKATQFDGNPNVQKAPEGPLGPTDDTPWKLKKKE